MGFGGSGGGGATSIAGSSDVTLNNPSNNQVLAYDSATSKWHNTTAPQAAVTSVAGKTGSITLTSADVGLGNVDNTADSAKPISTATQMALDGKATLLHTHDDRYYTETETDAALAAKLNASEKGATNGVATLGSDGKIPTSQLPALAINDTYTITSEVAMLGLTAQRGDIAIRTDTTKTYILATDNPGTLSDWKEITSASVAPVTSVAGKTGVVTLAKADVGLPNVDNTSDAAKPISTATQTALDGKAASTHTHAAADITSGTLAAGRLPAATEAAIGAVELATTTEAATGMDTTRAVTPAGVKAAIDGTLPQVVFVDTLGDIPIGTPVDTLVVVRTV